MTPSATALLATLVKLHKSRNVSHFGETLKAAVKELQLAGLAYVRCGWVSATKAGRDKYKEEHDG